MSWRFRLVVLGLLAAACARWANEPRFGTLPIDERRFEFQHNIELVQLANGMRVALIHDPRTNLATVDVRYDVGGAEDPPGKAGLAHLVEHLLFDLRATPGGPTLGDELSLVALYNNAYTMWDETHYTSTAPVEQLAALLELEARRMSAGCEQIDDAGFQRERDVVLAETAQRTNTTVEVQYEINAAIYGPGHPYARPVSSNQVAAATRADACAFIGQHYGANRVAVVISGPFDRATIRELVERSLGQVTKQAAARAPVRAARPDGLLTVHQAPIDKPTLLIAFPSPAWGDRNSVVYRAARVVLARRLSAIDDEHEQITGTSVFVNGGPRAPTLMVAVQLRDKGDARLAANQVFAAGGTMLDDVSPRAMSRLISTLQLDYVSRWDDLGGRGNWIADFMQYSDHTYFMLRDMGVIGSIDWNVALRAVGNELIEARAHAALVVPTGAPSAGEVRAAPAGSHDLVPWHAPVDPDAADRPLVAVQTPFAARIERYTLKNGLTVELAPDPASPIVDARLVFPVGRAHEPGDRRNVASAAAWLLDHDIEGFYEPQMVEKLMWSTSRGTESWAGVDETTTTFYARGLAHWGDWHVWYLSWLIDQGRYNQVHLERMHRVARQVVAEGPDEIDRDAQALRARLFGYRHPYAVPEPDVGTAYLRLGAYDLERWRRAYFRARGATLIVSGAFDVARMRRVIDELYAPWSGDAPPGLPSVPPATPPRGPSYLAAPHADAGQVTLTIGFALPDDRVEVRAARSVLREMIREEVRVVREGMGASYGVNAQLAGGVAGRALLVSGRIDEAKAGDVAKLVLAAIERLRADAGSQRASFVRARRKLLAAAVARTGGATAVAGELENLAGAGLPLDYPSTLAARIGALTPAEVAAVARLDLAPERMVVQVRGKPAVVAATFRALGVTPVQP